MLFSVAQSSQQELICTTPLLPSDLPSGQGCQHLTWKSDLPVRHQSILEKGFFTQKHNDESPDGLLWWHIYVSLTWVIIGSGNGFSPVQHQAITLTTDEILQNGPLRTNFTEIWTTKIFSQENAFKKSAKWCPDINVSINRAELCFFL